MKKVKRGTGITKKTVTEIERDWTPIFIANDDMEAKLGREPDWFDWVSFVPGEWAAAVLKNSKVKPEPESDTPEDFAQRILNFITLARYETNKGRADRAAHYAFQLGKLVAAVKIKDEWEYPAITGKKNLDGAKEGHKATYGTDEEKKQRWDNYQRALGKKMKDRPSLSLTEARKRVAADFKVSYQTIRDHTKDPRKKTV